VAGLSQASRVHRHRDTSRVLFVMFGLMLHGYSVAFRGGITEEIEGHLSPAPGVGNHASVICLQTGVSSGNWPMFDTKKQKILRTSLEG